MENCIFCQIINKKIPAQIVFENERVLAFPDIHPMAPVHILIIPKKHIASVAEISVEEESLMGEMVGVAKRLAENLAISQKGYKLLFRVGEDGGQEVLHIHLHLIGGAKLQEVIRPL